MILYVEVIVLHTRIRKAREERGYTREKFAEKLDVSVSYLAELERVIKEELNAEAPSVIITRKPCALLKTVKHNPPLKINTDKCKSCKACMKIGCPAISMADGKAKIDNTLCVGCKLCSQMCKFDAIEE